MIEFAKGDLRNCEADALVNSVNCVGVMGRGIALQFKEAFPDNFKAYARACKRGEVRPGRTEPFSLRKAHCGSALRSPCALRLDRIPFLGSLTLHDFSRQ